MKLLLLTVLLVAVNALVPLETHREVVRGSYLVTLKGDVNTNARREITHMIRDLDPVNEITHEWTVINGFSARMSHETLRKLRTMEDTIELIEEDGVMHAYVSCSSQSVPDSRAWGLRRVTNGGCTTGWTTFNLPSNPGTGTVNYVLDTGVLCSHTEFGGRAVSGASYINGENPCADGNGHGTHVAGTIAGRSVGLARSGTIVDVKVLSAGGSGSTSGVVSGVNYAATNAGTRNKNCGSGRCLATANMSLGGGVSSTLDNAVNSANSKGVLFVVAAGNSNANSCNASPARAAGAYTVGSTTTSNARSSFSNYGTCNNVFAPGSNIYSSWNNGQYNTISGTSMAAPHTAGVGALVMGASSFSDVEALKKSLTSDAISGCVSSPGSGSPNELSYACA